MRNYAVALGKAAKLFDIPTTITTWEMEAFSGNTYPALLSDFPDLPVLERTSMNSWDDRKIRDALAQSGRRHVVVSGLWTGICIGMFTFSAMAGGDYDIYMVAGA